MISVKRCAVFSLIGLVGLTAARAEEAPPGAGTINEAEARAAGARYGQAAGVALVCHGVKTTDAVVVLKARFEGETASAFDEEATKVLAAWRDLYTCKDATGPNECRLSHDFSCGAAMREIGPGGSAMPGLIAPK